MEGQKKANKSQFKPGQSGNPKGKPKGLRNKATLAAEKLLDGEAKTITRKAVLLAKNGDPTALKLVMDRILPPRKDRPVRLRLPRLKEAADVQKAIAMIAEAVGAGELTPIEAAEIAKVIEAFSTATLARSLEEKVAALEAARG